MGSPDTSFYGSVETVTDALRLIEAARKGVIPMYDDSKLESSGRVGFVWSGDVFVSWTRRSGTFDWVDGLSWSKPHSADLFLLVLQLEQSVSSYSYKGRSPGKALQPHRTSPPGNAVPKEPDSQAMLKPNGLVKKTFSVRVGGIQYHVVSYYTEDDLRSKRLQRPIHRPDIMALGIPNDLLDASNLRYSPGLV